MVKYSLTTTADTCVSQMEKENTLAVKFSVRGECGIEVGHATCTEKVSSNHLMSRLASLSELQQSEPHRAK